MVKELKKRAQSLKNKQHRKFLLQKSPLIISLILLLLFFIPVSRRTVNAKVTTPPNLLNNTKFIEFNAKLLNGKEVKVKCRKQTFLKAGDRIKLIETTSLFLRLKRYSFKEKTYQ